MKPTLASVVPGPSVTRPVSLEDQLAQLASCVEAIEARYADFHKRLESVRDHVPEDISPDIAPTTTFMPPAVERVHGANQRLNNLDRQFERLIESLRL